MVGPDFDVMMFFVGVFISLLVFLLCRELVCWYFKINEVTKLLKEIRDSLKKS